MAGRTHPLGIDIGGSGVKGAPVDLATGELVAERLKIETPQPATPEAVADVVAQIAEHFEGECQGSPVGITIPGIVRRGVMYSAANIDKSWIGVDVEELFSKRLGRPVTVLNDADAAGVAEMQFGAAKGVPGTVFLATLGTGIGTALLVDGVLVPNTELGHLELDGHDAETKAAASAREREGLKYPEWAKRLQRYFSHIEMLFSPDLIVVGGGVSRKSDKFLPLLKLQAPIIPAALRNAAGIVGAAWQAAHQAQPEAAPAPQQSSTTRKAAPRATTTARKTAAARTATPRKAAARTTSARTASSRGASAGTATARKTAATKATAAKTTAAKTTPAKATATTSAAKTTAAERTAGNATAKKTASKATAAKTTAAKTTAAKTTAAKTTAAKATTSRRTAATTAATAKKTTARAAAGTSATPRKTTARKTTARKTTARKTATPRATGGGDAPAS